MLLLKMGPEVPSKAWRALPALCEKEDGCRPSEFLVCVNLCKPVEISGIQGNLVEFCANRCQSVQIDIDWWKLQQIGVN